MHTDQLNSALSGRYTIDRLIGEGGMATVYLARDVRHQRNVALKVLRPDLGAVLGFDRFLTLMVMTNWHKGGPKEPASAERLERGRWKSDFGQSHR